ncbi:MAG: hypothetical protein GF350_14420 [Chitinivibrionales bacterium]|nr:hypothetical protein [Chitinivibrionales bacterium]
MKFPAAAVCVLTGALWASSCAISGIGVADVHSPQGSGIVAFFIRDNVQIDSIWLAHDSGVRTLRSPSINVQGSHCAFFRQSGADWTISVMRIGGVSKMMKDLVTFTPNDAGKGRIRSILLFWADDDYVWYCKELFPGEIWRVNVHTLANEHVCTIPGNSLGFNISRDRRFIVGNSGSVFLHEIPDLSSASLPFTLQLSNTPWNEGGTAYSGMCGQGVSPTGLYVKHNEGSGHDGIGLQHLNPATNQLEKMASIKQGQWNAWEMSHDAASLDAPDSIDNVFQTIGTGNTTEQNTGWACNSDLWTLNIAGWAPGGRYPEQGCNLGMIHVLEEKSLNITRFPHIYYIGEEFNTWHGDFWLSAPVEDIAEQYRDELETRNSYQVEGTDEYAVQISELLPVNSAARPGVRAVQVGNNIAISVNMPGKYEIISPDGRIMDSGTTAGRQVIISKAVPGSGIALIRVRSGEKTVSAKFVAR